MKSDSVLLQVMSTSPMSEESEVELPFLPEDESEQETVVLPSDVDSDGETIMSDSLPADPRPALHRSRAMVENFKDVYETITISGAPFQLVCEVFSPPRVTVRAQVAGHESKYAFDITYNGWDCMEVSMRHQLKALLTSLKPKMLVLSPPCTMFSALTRTRGQGD